MRASPDRVAEIEALFQECRGDWRSLLFRLERGPESYLAETPWLGLDQFVDQCDDDETESLRASLEEMLDGDDGEEQLTALGVLGSTLLPFDFSASLERAERFQKDLQVRLEWLLVVGQRQLVAVKAAVQSALADKNSRHAAAIALAQLDVEAAGDIGREMYEHDREEIVASLNRPLAEHDYATFLQMAEAVFELHGKEGINRFLRSVAKEDRDRLHEMAQVVQRILRQHPTAD